LKAAFISTKTLSALASALASLLLCPQQVSVARGKSDVKIKALGKNVANFGNVIEGKNNG
jgi:hypothetical protein